MDNFFDLPAVTERNLMPHVAELVLGADGVDIPLTVGERIGVFSRTTARFTGELAVWDGPVVPVGLRAEGEEFDVVLMAVENDGSTGIAVMRKGSNPKGGVAAGWLMVNTGTITVSTVEQLRAAPPDLPRQEPFVVPGQISDSVRIHNGFGDGPVAIVALIDEQDQMCGLVLGDLFEISTWEERILPGEELMSMQELHELLANYYAEEEPGKAMPVAVYKDGELAGYAVGADHHGSMSVFITDEPRPTTANQTDR